MRSSEELAFALFCAWARYEGEKDIEELATWDDIGEFQQKGYLDQVNTMFDWLFEHGRISAYLNVEQLEAFGEEYKAYLAEKNGIDSE